MPKTLYEILGIPPDADSSEVKKAYRKKAQKLHPDRDEGNKEAFQEVLAAYEVLIDEHKRAQYDADGTITNDVDAQERPLRELVAVLFSLLDRVEDVRYCNLVEESKKVVHRGIAKGRAAIEEMQERIVVRKEVISRLSCTEENILAQAIESDIAKIEAAIRGIEDSLGIGNRILEMLDSYSYTAEVITPTTKRFYEAGTWARGVFQSREE